ncbi:Very-short-patch-repair endonuclease [Tardiphaga sp. OK246]|uniref:endonuclease domain-containing protein n=1 Tax=Tardiphaga sp. OK246 TaxID=1855307 RepID=UPI000B636A43|nr:endonuclease domain-containing protein [Tardiphaga sp. OK246]SNT42517.1 Very-short-patch-repair endonuclease [Tardiphaga sp. OK246]
MRGHIRITNRSRELRTNSTDAETKLWNRLRNRQIAGCKFIRQEPIGRYICDFVCREKMIVIEVDGGQHLESQRDAMRDRYLREQGYCVLRFWNNDVLSNIEGVLSLIDEELRKTSD